ncbi:MAG: UDP-N-acetylmuramate--L-alanine ligase, partial [Elusimicrobia bacterium]|nr:UDP-N-acetylmuramate--L-alanine ligase [Elusimicrobiota bacterium]
MSGIAEVLLNLGCRVSGSDIEPTELTRRLAKAGARVFSGHDASRVRGASAVVVSSAVSDSNPEVRAARRAKIPILRRAQALAELVRLKKTVTVSGSHGKTTTTAMTAMALQAAGADPTMIIGGQLKNIGSNARLGLGKYLVAEADESDGSFLCLKPLVAVVTNIDNDHLDYYKTMPRIEDAFLRHLRSVLPGGACVVCADDPAAARLIKRMRGSPALAQGPRIIPYGLRSRALWGACRIRLTTDGSRFDLMRRGEKVASARLRVPGRHNVLNALGAVAAGEYLGFPLRKLLSGLAEFRGVGRRLEALGQAGGVTFLDDYGHHPTEIRATLEAVRELYCAATPNRRVGTHLATRRGARRRLIVIFQPHRYTRTKLLHREFGPAFRAADRAFSRGSVTEPYGEGMPLPRSVGERPASEVRWEAADRVFLMDI